MKFHGRQKYELKIIGKGKLNLEIMILIKKNMYIYIWVLFTDILKLGRLFLPIKCIFKICVKKRPKCLLFLEKGLMFTFK